MTEPNGWMTSGIAVGTLVVSAVIAFIDYRAEQREARADRREAARMLAEADAAIREALELATNGETLTLENDLQSAGIPFWDERSCLYDKQGDMRTLIDSRLNHDTDRCRQALEGIHRVLSETPQDLALATQQLASANAARFLAHTCKVRADGTQAFIGVFKARAEECEKLIQAGAVLQGNTATPRRPL